MTLQFFEKPILNTPYGYPGRYWELDTTGQPTQQIIEARRPAEFITPIPKPRKQKGAQQDVLLFDDRLSTQAQQYHSAIINSVRTEVDKWRSLKNPNDWRVTPETARLLQHWRHHNFSGVRPFFCQVEAAETAIWLTEVAPQIGKVPGDMLGDLECAKIVITNYHAFKPRERLELSMVGRLLLQGRGGDELNTLETEGQMLQRVMPDLMGMGNVLVINDEAHHCYREKPGVKADDEALKGDDRKEAEENNEAARLWIAGLEAVNRKLGVARVLDLSATPFFLRGSGYAARLHRAGGRRARRRRPVEPGGRDQGFSRRRRQGQEGNHGHLLGARCQPPWHPWPLGICRVHRGLPDAGKAAAHESAHGAGARVKFAV